ncbi:MAG: DUF1549 domain-containing protein [Planctomycetes bacterium]|nr:DUF1549 domain-containing protein [Planctomycetota bacterium]
MSDVAWVRHPLDAFVLARLEQEGLRPSPEADRATLLRRASLDLLGLPPTPEELDAFLADRADGAYERAVDRLFASPHYGERMAQHWLDLARYTDTNGYDVDATRDMWPWRDWVVGALNRDLPFDQFTIEQLAGDLLPEATLEQRVATGYLRNHAVAEDYLGEPGEYRHRYVADRVEAVATTWLGLTMACAECHDHKFDPLSQREYYSFYAFFDRAPERGLRLGNDNAEPRLRLPTAEQGARLLELQERLRDLEEREDRRRATAQGELRRWIEELAATPLTAALEGVVEHVALDASEPGRAELVGIGRSEFVPGVRGRALWLGGDDSFVQLGQQAAFRADEAFTLSAWVRLETNEVSDFYFVVGKLDEAKKGCGYGLATNRGRVSLMLIDDSKDTVELQLTARDPLPLGEWHHVLATYDGSREERGIALYVNGVKAELDTPRPAQKPASEGPPPAPKKLKGEILNEGLLRIGASDGGPFSGTLDEVRIFSRALPAEAVAALVRADLQAIAAQSTPRSREMEELLERHFLRCVDGEGADLVAQRRLAEAEHRTLLKEVAQVSVMSEMAVPRETRVLVRGDYSQPGELVEPAVPSVMGALPADAPKNRLGLARWLVDPRNPLVARVAANRMWRQIFGRGLSETVDDFGTRGERPSHPELLDWLAREFLDGGFSQKRFYRALVTSSTYRQASRIDAASLERDPENRLLARAARWRLDGEAVRDNALAIAGLLDRRLGGPSIKPWQPEDLWPEHSQAADRLRRGLYVHRARHRPFAAFTVLDAPNREVCVARRTSTTTPLQALVLLNERNHVEAARGLAQLLLQRPATDAERLVLAFRRCVARAPKLRELELLSQLLRRDLERYRATPDAAAKLLAVGDVPVPEQLEKSELAAWTSLAAVLLNLDETLTRG